jgi:hypothetical protein
MPLNAVAIAVPSQSKRAALLFDKIWAPWPKVGGDPADPNLEEAFNEIPEDVRFYNSEFDSILEIRLAQLLHVDIEAAKFLVGSSMTVLDPRMCYDFYRIITLDVLKYYNSNSFNIVPVYSTENEFHSDFPKGGVVAYQAAFENLPLISAANPWDQILDFREDKKAVKKYRNLGLWIDDALKASSLSHAIDLIEKKIEDYEWAIKKHGFKTVTGALSSILSSDTLVSIAAGGGIAAIIGGSLWASLVAGLIISGKISVWVCDRLIDLEDVKRGQHSEVALLYDAKKKFANENRKNLEKSQISIESDNQGINIYDIAVNNIIWSREEAKDNRYADSDLNLDSYYSDPESKFCSPGCSDNELKKIEKIIYRRLEILWPELAPWEKEILKYILDRPFYRPHGFPVGNLRLCLKAGFESVPENASIANIRWLTRECYDQDGDWEAHLYHMAKTPLKEIINKFENQ